MFLVIKKLEHPLSYGKESFISLDFNTFQEAWNYLNKNWCVHLYKRLSSTQPYIKQRTYVESYEKDKISENVWKVTNTLSQFNKEEGFYIQEIDFYCM
jgi:hypothetical protein